MLKNWFWKYRLILLVFASTAVFAGYYFSVFSTNYTKPVESFRKRFVAMEIRLNRFLDDQKQRINSEGEIGNWNEFEEKNSFNLHVYRNDSLIYWNTNQLPIIRFADIHYPAEGITHLQNGWYYAKTVSLKGYTICGSFLIKHDYSYQNKDLINDFVRELNIPFDATISLEQNEKYAIYSRHKEFLFSLIPNEYQPANEKQSMGLLFLLINAVVLWLIYLFTLGKKLSVTWRWGLFLAVILLRILSIKLDWFGFMHDTHGFQPSLYGTNEWFPNFFEYLVNCAVIAYSVACIRSQILETHPKKNRKAWSIGLFLLSFPFWALILYLNKGLIENSSIPLIIDQLFSLNFYSLLAIVSIGVLFHSFFRFVQSALLLNKRSGVKGPTLVIIAFFAGITYLLLDLNWGYQLAFASLFPLVFNAISIYRQYKEDDPKNFGVGLLFLILFSFVTAVNLAEFNKRKERSERELYANQLATERDVVTEIEYASIVDEIKSDNVLQKFIGTPRNMNLSDFEDGLERRIFNGFWERYEMNFYLVDTAGNSLITGTENQKNIADELNEIIHNHGIPSEIDGNMFFVSDYTGKYSYIARQPISSEDSVPALLFCTLKSKKIPEEIGFPRLLISSEAKVFESLENYSIAKYHRGKLVTKYGSFTYPSSDKPLKTWPTEGKNYSNFDGYNHYVLRQTDKDLIVLSHKIFTWVELVTSFSYLFSFYGILLFPYLFRLSYSSFFKRTVTLAMKIQLLLIGLVFVSLLAFGWGSGIFVSNQYNEYTNDVIREKLVSVELELRGKLGNEEKLNINESGNYMEYLLQKFSKVFVTDINLYDPRGYILASSRPKVFNVGLLGEQMNPTALHALMIKSKSEFVHQENIGKLNYASAYMPFYSHEGTLLGYVNLQHFGQQTEFENQIQRFLVAIINVFMLLLAISIVLAIFVSNWVTAPLRLLQESFANVRFGKYNQQIQYDKEDEIGALVKDYNQKLEELEYAAQQLAQNERESAWREMAKQVAHEIKNPLTPMKLSIQQLLRVYDPNDPNAEKKLIKVANSIIEQIDALTKIANEFSNFAKMPKPNEISLDLLPILENVIEVFRQEANCTIQLRNSLREIPYKADKDQMIRVFNNLLKNAIQAIPEERQGKILVETTDDSKVYIIRFTDNGVGIPEEKRSKIFVPYFTTKSTGTGLGLAMVKQIIENHRGTIFFETTENEGTIFTIELPKD